jgi:hypothetical protein
MQKGLDQNKAYAYWQVVGASVQGSAHQAKEVPCQDDHSYRVLENGVLLIVVADGAGSAPEAAKGSSKVVETAMDSLVQAIKVGPPVDQAGWEDLLSDVFFEARGALIELAEEENHEISDYATTLTCAIVGPEWLAAGQVGDGLVVAQGKDQDLFSFIKPQRGEYANETAFLSMENALTSMDVKVIQKPIAAVAVMSDGILRLAVKLPDYQPHEPFFQPIMTFVADNQVGDHAEALLEKFLASERVCARTEDDKTLVVAVQASSTVNPDSKAPITDSKINTLDQGVDGREGQTSTSEPS